MSLLGSKVSDLADIQKAREALEAWVQNQENLVADMLQRPAKFRSDASQNEIATINGMKQTIAEKQAVVDDIEMRLANMGVADDHQLRIALDTLDEHVSPEAITSQRYFL